MPFSNSSFEGESEFYIFIWIYFFIKYSLFQVIMGSIRKLCYWFVFTQLQVNRSSFYFFVVALWRQVSYSAVVQPLWLSFDLQRSLLDDDLEDMDSESEEEEERQVCQESSLNNIKESQFWWMTLELPLTAPLYNGQFLLSQLDGPCIQ